MPECVILKLLSHLVKCRIFVTPEADTTIRSRTSTSSFPSSHFSTRVVCAFGRYHGFVWSASRSHVSTCRASGARFLLDAHELANAVRCRCFHAPCHRPFRVHRRGVRGRARARRGGRERADRSSSRPNLNDVTRDRGHCECTVLRGRRRDGYGGGPSSVDTTKSNYKLRLFASSASISSTPIAEHA